MQKTRILHDIIDDIPIIYIEGNMTSESDEKIMDSYKQIIKKHSPSNIIINLERTEYINSAGIATLINIIKDMNKESGKVYLSSLSTHFTKIMNIVGITDFIQIFDSNTEAIAEINSEIDIP